LVNHWHVIDARDGTGRDFRDPRCKQNFLEVILVLLVDRSQTAGAGDGATRTIPRDESAE